jgi:hypothetical protein
MLTLNAILKEIKHVPLNRLEELFQFVNSLTSANTKSDTKRKKIMSFSGAFKDMAKSDYSAYLSQTKKTRAKTFNRNLEL